MSGSWDLWCWLIYYKNISIILITWGARSSALFLMCISFIIYNWYQWKLKLKKTKKIKNLSTTLPRCPFKMPSKSFKRKSSTNLNSTNTSRTFKSIALLTNSKINFGSSSLILHTSISEYPMEKSSTNLETRSMMPLCSLTVAHWLGNAFSILDKTLGTPWENGTSPINLTFYLMKVWPKKILSQGIWFFTVQLIPTQN